MHIIHENLYQFTTYIPLVDFTLHQYLLATEPAILFATGTMEDAKRNLPQIREVLGERPLQYIFVSHMESDECGGLSVFLEEFPEAVVLCSALCARELPGYGCMGKIKICTGGETLKDGALSLRFFDYPSEVHLQDGLLCLEENSGIFYSADLMLRNGNGEGQVISGSWQEEVSKLEVQNATKQSSAKLTEELLKITPKMVAVGHGFCMRTLA